MSPFSISSPNVLSDAFRTTLHLGSNRNTVTTSSDGSVDHSGLQVDSSSGVTEPPAPDSNGTRVQSPAAVTLPPYTGSYQQPLSDEARIKKQQELFDSVIDGQLGTIPVRLIDTLSGKLCSTGELYARFKESRNYKEVQTKIIRANEKEMKVAVDAFFEYAMLSHRWSTTVEDEPTYDHIKGEESIYDLKTPPGIEKLQQFCKVARENHFRWAWSDTCCIDKTNNVELQESIISMFSWYRLSSVTITYLSDVTDEESFRNSVWFTRGWTLQELIAPGLVWFYKKDWTPYIDSKQNHKNDPHVVKIISEVTSIDATDLNKFVPGLHVGSDEVKKRMSWLASRKTAKIEDMAYCMMGRLPPFG
ncbi:heterokaryon incompatibility protein-domain-containing protein [Suillus subaureus]|uniref:Heterokaryon incompatibility protein-domain-containing protein n=1 Tax=Suillus subaureus TaxID=48587 RepID=A0A9P7DXT0_9AGAM|nr:heterokaryon incompatibility protein-domain-containing protein [Suillus subaureus]KAG1805703.1 heterokaryon incompatibility protein-domain-containing protein [Suillus subaureus]